MAEDRKQAEALDEDALDNVVGGGAQNGMNLAAETNEEDNIAAAPSGTAWAKPFRKIARTIK